MKVFGKLRQRVKDRRAASRERYAEEHASSTKDMGGPRMHGQMEYEINKFSRGGPPTGP
jgi:hypothetical protein